MQIGRDFRSLVHFEAPAVCKGRNPRARGRDLARVDACEYHAGLRIGLRDDATPRINNKRMAKGLSPVLVQAALGGCENKGTVLDRPGAIEHVPMRLPGLLGESGRDCEK